MIEHILEVRISNETFGIDADKIAHVLRIPPITPLPVVDNSIKGISIILGKIISVVDISSLLGLKECDIHQENSRILTISNDTSLMVDEVLDMINVEPENFEKSDDNIILGIYKQNKNIIQVLNVENLLMNLQAITFNPKKIEIVSQKIQEKAILDIETKRCLFFKLANEKFCMDISIIQEVIFIPEITPNTNPTELGIITLRDEVMPLIEMRKIFHFKESVIDEKSRAIIVKYNNSSIAFLVDEIEEVKDIDVSMIENIENEQFQGIFKGENISSVLSNNYIQDMVNLHNISESVEEIQKRDNEMIEVVVFKIDNEEFAFDINNVQEIIKYEKATFFPQAPKFVEGLLNLRGSVIPIISLPKKLGFDEKITEKTKIVVCNINNEKIGFIVNDVSDIMFIEDIYLSKVENEDSIFDEIINLDGDRVIFKINIDKIFTDEELDGIKLTKIKNG